MIHDAVIFDIDGTLSDVSHREKLVRPYCPQCEGTGSFEAKDPCGNVIDEPVECLPCGGTGVRKLRSEDWDKFYAEMGNDKPNYPVIDLLQMARHSYTQAHLIMITGRPERYRQVTETWIHKYIVLAPDQYGLIMRGDKDFRPDHKMKADVYRKRIEPNWKVIFWLEDRDSVVKMVRHELGLPCFQVRDGNF